MHHTIIEMAFEFGVIMVLMLGIIIGGVLIFSPFILYMVSASPIWWAVDAIIAGVYITVSKRFV